jgi:TrmH family RNA methyltransferase
MVDLSTLKTISSAQNEAIKQLIKLQDSARERRKSGLMVLEGFHLAQAAMQHGVHPEAVYINPHACGHHELTPLLAALPASCRCAVVAEGALAKLSALASAPEVLTVAPRPHPGKPASASSCILLEDVQDPGNLGTMLRSAAASGVREVFLSKGCADVYSPKVLRSGMGAHFALSIHEDADLESVLAAFAGSKVVTALDGAVSLYAVDLTGPVAFVFGNEGSGVSAQLQALAKQRVKIPMPGEAESLNVAMAASVCLFERVRQLEVKR